MVVGKVGPFEIRENISMQRDGVSFINWAIACTPLGYPDGVGGVVVAVHSGARAMSYYQSDVAKLLASQTAFVTSERNGASRPQIDVKSWTLPS